MSVFIESAEAEYRARMRRGVLDSIRARRYAGEPMRETLIRYLAEGDEEIRRLREAVEWAHGYISSTDKAAADRLHRKAEGADFRNRWDVKPS